MDGEVEEKKKALLCFIINIVTTKPKVIDVPYTQMYFNVSTYFCWAGTLIIIY